jgi:hypothetical protein
MHRFASQFVTNGLAAQSAPHQPKKQLRLWANRMGSRHSGMVR